MLHRSFTFPYSVLYSFSFHEDPNSGFWLDENLVRIQIHVNDIVKKIKIEKTLTYLLKTRKEA
jgi:hypothetical protein